MLSMLFVVLFAALAMAGLKDLACCDPLRKDTRKASPRARGRRNVSESDSRRLSPGRGLCGQRLL